MTAVFPSKDQKTLNYIQQLPKTASGHIVGGRYRVVRQLGVGGFSQTFLAEDTQLPSYPRCVVKQLKPQARNLERWPIAKRLFATEAQVLYQLGHHDQIPRLFAHFEDHQEFYLVQELVEGESLQELFIPEQPWTERRVIVLLRDILQILVFVHEQNVIHRDIKPSNIICRKQDGRVTLIDFGAVKQVSAPLLDAIEGQMMTISIGTQGYVPTEQLSGSPRFNSDIYAVGIIGIQILTGIRPDLLEREVQTNEIIWRDRQTNLPGTAAVQVSSELATILDRMVCYHFRDRYQTATEPLQALEELLQQRSDIVPAVEFAALASEAAIAWDRVEQSFEPFSSSPSETTQVKPAVVVFPKHDSAIAPTSFGMAPESMIVQTEAVSRPAARDLTAFQSPLPRAVIAQIRSIFQTSTQRLYHPLRWHPNIWRIGIVGGLGIAAIAFFSHQANLLNLPRSTQVLPTATPLPMALLRCREPLPGALPSRESDYEYPDGTRYYGAMANGRPTDGRVIMVFPAGNRYDGEFKEGRRTGCGIYTFANGKRYIGQFQNDRFEGQGMWILQNGDRYIGGFQNNRCQGQGIFIFANGSPKRGMWQDGNLINGDLSCNR
jgi:serine/threonine protein kinase